ncbi:MAG: hypothetical protein ACRDRN_09280 [Sciscionella sp.]
MKRSSGSMVIVAAVSAVVAVAALTASYMTRSSAIGLPAAPSAAAKGSACGPGACTVIERATVGRSSVELLADRAGDTGSLRVTGVSDGNDANTFDISITQNGATLTGRSLACRVLTVPACVVTGRSSQGTIGEVFLMRDVGWSQIETPFVSDGGYLELTGSRANGSPEVVAAQRSCGATAPAKCQQRGVFAQVFSLTGGQPRCTSTVSALSELPGWPDVNPHSYQLGTCP